MSQSRLSFMSHEKQRGMSFLCHMIHKWSVFSCHFRRKGICPFMSHEMQSDLSFHATWDAKWTAFSCRSKGVCLFMQHKITRVMYFSCLMKSKGIYLFMSHNKQKGLCFLVTQEAKRCVFPCHIRSKRVYTSMSHKVCFRINVDLAIFQPYLDLEAGDNQSLKIQVARPGIEPRSSCSASQELNHSATAAPICHIRSKEVYLFKKSHQTQRDQCFSCHIRSKRIYFVI